MTLVIDYLDRPVRDVLTGRVGDSGVIRGDARVALFEQPANDGTGGESSGRNGEDSLGKSEIFDVLRNERRRYVLRHLDAAGGEGDLDELADALAERESDDGTFDHRDRKRTYVSLYQNHLPRLDDVGIVDYDRRSGRVRLAPAFDRVEPYLYDRQGASVRWRRMYLTAGLIGTGIVVSGYLSSSIPRAVGFGTLAGIACFLVAARLLRSAGRIYR